MDDLKQWTINFMKAKDVVHKKILKVDEHAKDLVIEYKDKKVTHFIIDKLEDSIFKNINNADHKVVVCPNEQHNLDFTIKHWNKFSDIKNLNMMFVNLKNHEKWMINPKVHSMIADPESIAQGLKAMFDTANGKVDDAPKGKKKPSPMFESTHDDEDPEAEEN